MNYPSRRILSFSAGFVLLKAFWGLVIYLFAPFAPEVPFSMPEV